MANINGSAEDIVLKSDLLNFIYPIGTYYWSSQSTSPEELFGGSWEQIKDKFILSAGETYSAGEKGGSATHTLKESEMPRHTHISKFYGDAPGDYTMPGGNSYLVPQTGYRYSSNNVSSIVRGDLGSTTAIGGNTPHNNMPPYEVAYCWKRIA